MAPGQATPELSELRVSESEPRGVLAARLVERIAAKGRVVPPACGGSLSGNLRLPAWWLNDSTVSGKPVIFQESHLEHDVLAGWSYH